MTKQEKINEINTKYSQDYKLNKSGRIYSEFMGKKRWYKFEEIISDWKIFEKEQNARKNAKETCKFIEKAGGELTYKSMYGANYYDYKGYKIRISNHDWTSEKHLYPDVNLCSYELSGYNKMISELKSIN